ncbi:MAG: 30S ribosomal protein S4 [Christensenellales bacterium]|jgi:small subunit ribosomal protein S4
MAKYTDSVCRLCRREGTKLFLKGDRCYSAKCALGKRQSPPGQHGQSRKRVTEYGMHLREKQKVRRAYGMLEKQFAGTFAKASRIRGIPTGEALLQLLELRFDNVAYRLGFGASRAQARQMVTHNHLLVNGKKNNIPSMQLQVGDVITVAGNSRDIEIFKALREGADHPIPKWLELNADALEGKILQKPERSDIDLTLSEHLVVEFYSK